MDWKDTDFNFIFVEEINSDGGGVNKALQGLSVDDTVEALKRAIATELRTPQQWSSVTVFNAAQEMDKLDRKLSSYDVQLGDTLYFARAYQPARSNKASDVPPPYVAANTKILNNVMFKDIDGKTLTLTQVPITWTVKQLIEKLGEEKRFEAEYFRFLWSGKQLQDEKTLESYGLVNDCTIHMMMRLRGGCAANCGSSDVSLVANIGFKTR